MPHSTCVSPTPRRRREFWLLAASLAATTACTRLSSDRAPLVNPTPPSGSIGDRVWSDLNCDGIQDPGEPGLDGVKLTLRDSDGVEVGTAVTGTVAGRAGVYRFGRLAAGTYTIDVDSGTATGTPSPCAVGGNRAVDSDCAPATVVLVADDSQDSSVDFGFCPPAMRCEATIGDRVWHDLDCDGIQDAGEPGLDGVTLRLRDGTGALLATATSGRGPTGERGHYQFSGVCAGTYEVEVDLTTLPPGFYPSPCGVGTNPFGNSECTPTAVTVVGSEDDPSIDFGFCSSGSGVIGDFVWHDVNGDGIQNPDELDDGIDGVRVVLRDAIGAELASTATARGGSYAFTGLLAGTYSVEIDGSTLPPGFSPTASAAGSNPALDSNASPAMVVLPTDDSVDLSIDFGFVGAGAAGVGDFVWLDLDADGLQSSGEPGLFGVRVQLRDASGAVVRVDDTDAAGGYSFFGLVAGTYTVEVDAASVPGWMFAAPCRVGSNPALDNDCSPASVTLAANQYDPTVDFGFVSGGTALVGDFVWLDDDADGVQDPGEPGISGAVVELRDPQLRRLMLAATDSMGVYTFPALPGGDYLVQVDPTSVPAGLAPSPCEVGVDPALDSNCAPAAVNLAPGEIVLDIDFGFQSPCSARLGDLVWYDADCDGLQEAGEPGIAGVTVLLRDAAYNVIGRTVTDGNGLYLFSGLCEATYVVEVDETTLPPNLAPSPCNIGPDDTIDNDCSPATVSLISGSVWDLSVDFGYLPHFLRPPSGTMSPTQ